jgi:hypothetical protein
MTAAAHFPGVDLMDGHVPAANLNAAGPASWSDAAAEHPSSAESDHSSASWWEKSPTPTPTPTHTHPGPTRTP